MTDLPAAEREPDRDLPEVRFFAARPDTFLQKNCRGTWPYVLPAVSGTGNVTIGRRRSTSGYLRKMTAEEVCKEWKIDINYFSEIL